SVLVLVDPVEVPKLTAWLDAHGIVLRDDVVIDRANRVYGSDGTNAIVPFYREHDVTRAMDIPAVLGRARSVSLKNGADDDDAAGTSIVARTANESCDATGRLVLVGDADFPSDGFLPLLGNKDLLVNTIGWLVADRAVGARPREQATKLGPVSPVYVSDEQSRFI